MFTFELSILPKTEHCVKLLFSFPSEIFSPNPVFGSLFICSFKFWITYIWANTEKCPFSSNCSFSVSPCIHTVKLKNIGVRCVLFRTLWSFVLNLSCLFPLQIFHIWTWHKKSDEARHNADKHSCFLIEES